MIMYLNIKECLSTGLVLPPLPPFPSREHCCDPTLDHIFSIQNNKPRCAFYMNSVGMLHVSDAVPTCIIFVRISLVMRIIGTFCFRARAIPHLTLNTPFLGIWALAVLLFRMQFSGGGGYVDIADVKLSEFAQVARHRKKHPKSLRLPNAIFSKYTETISKHVTVV